MSKDGVVQTIFKVSNKTKGEALIFDVLSNCENKTDLIKNALFYYIVNIQNGNIIDRAYPYNVIEKYTELEKDKVIYSHNMPYNYVSNNTSNQEEYNDDEFDEDEYDEGYDEEELDKDEYNEYEDDNMDII